MTKDLIGKRFERLTVVGKSEDRSKWKCLCDCGNVTYVITSNLTRGNTKSCGCLQKEMASAAKKTHGLRKHRLYHIYNHMIDRCTNHRNPSFPRYGGRGITVCNEWLNSFQDFANWAFSNGYSDDLTIDRIDNNKGYSPDNCRWATMKEQSNNREGNRYVTINGETHTLMEWSEINHIKYMTIIMRISRGWTDEKAVSTPARRYA